MGGTNSKAVVIKHNARDFASYTQHDPANEGKDIYELFGLERYCEMNASNMEKMRNAKNRLQRIYHPDRNVNKSRKERETAELMSRKINDAVHILTSSDLKRRHDIQLRRQYKEGTVQDSITWWVRWLGSIIAAVAGAAMIVLGAPILAPGLLIGGGALLVAGINGGVKQYQDPDCPWLAFGKAVAVGAIGGGIGGAIGLAAAPAMLVAGLGAKVGIAAGVAAADAAANHLVRDGVDLAINAAGGEYFDCRSNDEILCLNNVKQLAGEVVISAACGAVAQHVANKFLPNANVIGEEIAAAAQIGAKNDVVAMGLARMEVRNFARLQAAAPRKGFMRIAGEKILENAAGHGVGLAGGFVRNAAVRVHHSLNEEKSFLTALENGCYEAGKDVVISLPGIIVSIVAGSLLSAGCEKYVQKVNVNAKQDILARFNAEDHSHPVLMHANGLDYPNVPQPAPGNVIDENHIAFGRQTKEHVFERHVGPLEIGITRNRVRPDQTASIFHDIHTAEAAVEFLGRELAAEIHGIDFASIPKKQQVFKDRHDRTWKKIVGEWIIHEAVITRDMGAVVGVAADQDSRGVMKFTNCTNASARFGVKFTPATGVTNLDLVTAFPTPAPDAVGTTRRPMAVGKAMSVVDQVAQIHHDANAKANVARHAFFFDEDRD